MVKHWEHIEVVESCDYRKFIDHDVPLQTRTDLPANTAVFIECATGGKRLEGIYDAELRAIRSLKNKSAPNRDMRLYLDAVLNENITMIAVDGLMGTGKTSTCIEELCRTYLKNASAPKTVWDTTWKPDPDIHRILIAKPNVSASGEDYGYLPGDINEKLDPKLQNFIQYFNRFHFLGFNKLRELGYVEILPLGFVRGLDAKNMTVIVDECQNTMELVSVATRKAEGSRIFFLGDTSPFQIDNPNNTPSRNGLTQLVDLLQGASYFQYIEMKTVEHILRGEEVRDIVRR
jgi:predicted ribonuclease YlaK